MVAIRERLGAMSPNRQTWQWSLKPILIALPIAAGIGALSASSDRGALAAVCLVALALMTSSIVVFGLRRVGAGVLAIAFFLGTALSGSQAFGPSVAQSGATTSLTVRVVPYVIFLVAAGVLLMMRAGARLKDFWVPLVAYLVLALFATLTAPAPAQSILRFGLLVAPAAAAVMAARAFGPSEIAIKAVIAGAGVNVALAMFLHATGSGGVAQIAEPIRLGGFLDPNLLAFQAALVITWSFDHWLRKDPHSTWWLVLAGAAGWALLLSRSRTSFVATGVMIAALLVLAPRAEQSAAAAVRRSLSALALLLVSTLLVGAISQWFIRGNAREITELTGRVDVWPAVVSYIRERPRGWGPGALSLPPLKSQIALIDPLLDSHNSFLEAGLTAGILGMLAWLSMMLLLGRRMLVNLRKRVTNRPMLVLWLGLAVFSVTEAKAAGVSTPWFAVMALALATPWKGTSQLDTTPELSQNADVEGR